MYLGKYLIIIRGTTMSLPKGYVHTARGKVLNLGELRRRSTMPILPESDLKSTIGKRIIPSVPQTTGFMPAAVAAPVNQPAIAALAEQESVEEVLGTRKKREHPYKTMADITGVVIGPEPRFLKEKPVD